MTAMQEGLASTLERTVTEADTARALGSGDLPVLGTPRLLAWLEAATCAAVANSLEPGRTTVGVRVDVRHRAASPVGAVVTARATVTSVDGDTIVFRVDATDPQSGRVLGQGEITRAVVDRERFLARVSG